MMDTSKEYIDQCRKAVKIQEVWKQLKADWFVSPNMEIIVFDPFFEVKGDSIWFDDGFSFDMELWKLQQCVWLPRQDQLQDMVDLSRFKFHIEYFDGSFYFDYEKDCKLIDDTPLFGMKSMEQLWLAFVMHEKYNKKWNGKDWLEIN